MNYFFAVQGGKLFRQNSVNQISIFIYTVTFLSLEVVSTMVNTHPFSVYLTLRESVEIWGQTPIIAFSFLGTRDTIRYIGTIQSKMMVQ